MKIGCHTGNLKGKKHQQVLMGSIPDLRKAKLEAVWSH